MVNSASLYGTIVSKEIKRIFTYRTNIISGVLSSFLSLFVRYSLWSALFSNGNTQGSTLEETITFFVLNDIVLVLYATQNNAQIGADIRSGDIATKLIRPYSYHLHLLSISHANALSSVILNSVPKLFAAMIFIGLLPPVSIMAFFCFILTFMFGLAIYSLIDLIICYTAFWLTTSWYLPWFSRALFNLFGGLVIPLWFYPAQLAGICRFLPFQYAVYQPMGFYLGRIPVGEIGNSLLIQLFWVCLLFLLERSVWNRARKVMTVQGG